MEIVFGTEERGGISTEVIKVKNNKPVVMSGNFSFKRENDIETITDCFTITRKIRDKEANGYYYAWYEICNHYRYVDRFEQGIAPVNGTIAETQDALCEASDDFETRIADIEDALCELTEV